MVRYPLIPEMNTNQNRKTKSAVSIKSSVCSVVFLSQILLTTSCDEKPDLRTGEKDTAAEGSRFVGIWEASGPDIFGAYRIRMAISDSGECEAEFVFQEKDSNLSMKQTDTVNLVGKWESRDGKLTTTFKVVNWVNFNPRGTTQERDVEDFSFSYNWKLNGKRLVMDTGHSSARFKLGTSKEARAGDKMVFEGKGYQVDFTEFEKVGDGPLANGAENQREDFESSGGKGSVKLDPVGEWTTKGRSPKFYLCFWESGEAGGEFEDDGNSIYLDGRWQRVEEGRWMGYVTFSGRVDHWGVDSDNMTPKDEKFEFMFELTKSSLTYVRGGILKNRNGGEFHPSGVDGNEDPVLYRQNSQRPVRREAGNK